MRKFFEQITVFFKKHRQIVYFTVCLCVSFFLWLFVTYGKEYEHTMSFTVKFTDQANNVEYFTKDSVIILTLKSNGFEFLAHSGGKSNRKIIIDVDKLNLNLSNGNAVIATSRLKPQITESLGYRASTLSISPSTINLNWKKIYRKSVDIVSDNEYVFQKPYEIYNDEQLLVKHAVIEGEKELLDKVKNIHTQKIQYSNINKTTVLLAPLMMDSLPDGVRCHLSCVPVKVSAEAFTEDVAYLNVKVVSNENFRNIYVFPEKVKLRYRVAMKDYRKFKPQDISAYVLFSEEDLEKNHRLRIHLGNVPDYIKPVSIYPESAEFLVFK